MRAERVLLCGCLAWPAHPSGDHRERAYAPALIPTAATVEVAELVPGDPQRWKSTVRYNGRIYSVPTSLLAIPAEAFRSLKKGK